MNIHSLAILLSFLLLIYHQVTTWFPLYPWNDVEKYSRKELLLETSINGILMGLAALSMVLPNSGFWHYYPLIYFPFLLVGECVDWWIPYFSETFAKKRKIWDYDSHFSRTLKLIPHIPGKRTPDANHIVFHFITILTFVVVYIDRLSDILR